MHTDTLTEEALWQAIAQLGRGDDQPQPDPRLVLADLLEERGEREELREVLRWAVKEGNRPLEVIDHWVWYDASQEWRFSGPEDLDAAVLNCLPGQRKGRGYYAFKSVSGAYEALATALTRLQEKTP